jgi:uncharacterized protein YuzE
MDGNIMQIECPDIKFNTLENLKLYTPKYHGDVDVFYLKSDEPKPATSYDLNGIAWLRIDIETGEIVGLQIDDFESVFLKKYPELLSGWKQVKSLCIHKKSEKCADRSRESFILIILSFLKSLFPSNPYQLRTEIN